MCYKMSDMIKHLHNCVYKYYEPVPAQYWCDLSGVHILLCPERYYNTVDNSYYCGMRGQ